VKRPQPQSTAIFAKIGIENVNSDFATFIRTIVILCALGAILIKAIKPP
jgi:bacterial/archaeal transporter family protein